MFFKRIQIKNKRGKGGGGGGTLELLNVLQRI